MFPGIHGGRVNHWATFQINGQGESKLSNPNCPTNKNPYPGNWGCVFNIEEIFLTMIKDVFLQITGEILFSVIEDMNLQIIGDIFLQNLVCIISKLGIYLFAELRMYFCRMATARFPGRSSRRCVTISHQKRCREFFLFWFYVFLNVVLAVS